MNFSKQKVIYQNIGAIGFHVLDGFAQKRAGFSMELFRNWSYIVGKQMADLCYPYKLSWPRAVKHFLPNEAYKPAILILYCDSVAVTEILHKKIEIIERVNNFFGYKLINNLRFVQEQSFYKKTSTQNPAQLNCKTLLDSEKKRLKDMVSNIEDLRLKSALLELGNLIYLKDSKKYFK